MVDHPFPDDFRCRSCEAWRPAGRHCKLRKVAQGALSYRFSNLERLLAAPNQKGEDRHIAVREGRTGQRPVTRTPGASAASSADRQEARQLTGYDGVGSSSTVRPGRPAQLSSMPITGLDEHGLLRTPQRPRAASTLEQTGSPEPRRAWAAASSGRGLRRPSLRRLDQRALSPVSRSSRRSCDAVLGAAAQGLGC